MPTFHEFTSEWFEARKLEGGRREQGPTRNGEADLRWRLSNHLLPAFARKRLDQITKTARRSGWANSSTAGH